MESSNFWNILDKNDCYYLMEYSDFESINSKNVYYNNRRFHLNYKSGECVNVNNINNNNLRNLKSFINFSNSNKMEKINSEQEKDLKCSTEKSIYSNIFNMKYKYKKNKESSNFNLLNLLQKLKNFHIPFLYNDFYVFSNYKSKDNFIYKKCHAKSDYLEKKEIFKNNDVDIITSSNKHLNKLKQFSNNLISNYLTVNSFLSSYTSTFNSSSSSTSTSTSTPTSNYSSSSLSSSFEYTSYKSAHTNMQKKGEMKFFNLLSFKDSNKESSIDNTYDEYYRRNKKSNYLLPKKEKKRKERKRKEEKKKINFFYEILKTIKKLCNEIFIRSFQTMISYFITTSFFIILNLYVSNTCDYYEIAGFGVAISVYTVLSSVIDGLSNSLDFFCSHSIGIGNADFSWLILNCTYFMFFFFCFFVFFFFFLLKFFMYIILRYIFCNLKNEYIIMLKAFISTLQILLISFLPLFLYESTRRFLILHNNIYPSLLTSIFSFFLLNLFCYLFVFKFHLKYIGASLSFLLVSIINFLFILFFLKLYIEKCKCFAKNVHLFESKEDKREKHILFINNDNYNYENEVPHLEENAVNEKQLKVMEEQLDGVKKERYGYKEWECGDTIVYDEEYIKSDDNNNIFSKSDDCERKSYSDKNTFIHIKNPSIYNLYFLFCHIPSDEVIKFFLKITKVNIKNVFFEVLAFELQLFESTYLCLTSTATFVQITNFLNLVYYVSNSYGIVLSKITGIYISSNQNKKKKRKFSEIVLAFFLLLFFLYFCLIIMYIYHKNIILFFYSDINLQNKLMEIFPLLIVELLFEALCSLLNSIIKGIGLQHKISFFTFFNFMFLMHLLGLILAFYVNLDLYGFIYSNLISMIIQVIFLVSFLGITIWKRHIFS
ncbi:multidrug efflux pump, putative [Plasmodium relictum]|uniref:Multidrug efflux pump, putative n=1 Tax=Plasmodium relictum TaxID=85471 RepID=A0A1J1H1C4_PLARL|nr:multidrug efflux pump, putative [Plasmodium relictum]CRG98722.1 multidrug efflux pump, putative [Plasmodium relictum]